LQVAAEALTAAAFAPFGEVVEHRGDERRHYLSTRLGNGAPALRETVWISRVSTAASSPMRFCELERHPFSDQVFVPLRGQPFLAIACPERDDGAPDLPAARAFRAAAHQGIVWRPGVWHGRMTVLSLPAEFVVMMAVRGEGDDVFLDLPEPIDVTFGEPASVC
jgi:ureidoglycolate lyase